MLDDELKSFEQQFAKISLLKEESLKADDIHELRRVVFELCKTFEAYLEASDPSWQNPK